MFRTNFMVMIGAIIMGLVILLPQDSYSQCQGSQMLDSGPVAGGKMVPTNMLKEGPDYNFSIFKNYREKNLLAIDKGHILISILLMFFCIFAPKSLFFQASIVLYGAPFVIYVHSFRGQQNVPPEFLIILSLLMFIWGSSFSFKLFMSKKIFLYVLSLLLLLIPGGATYHIFKDFAFYKILMNINQLLVMGDSSQLTLLLFYFFVAVLIITLFHGVFINIILKDVNKEIEEEKKLPNLLVKTIFFIVWCIILCFAKPIAVYLFTIFILGTVFKEKNIIENSLHLLRKHTLLFIFLYMLWGKFSLGRSGVRDLIYRDLDKFVIIIGVVYLLYFLIVFILKKLFKDKINTVYMTSVHPLFMLSYAVWPKNLVNKDMLSIFYISSLLLFIMMGIMI